MLVTFNFEVHRLHKPFALRLLAALIALLYVWMTLSNVVSTSHDPAKWDGHEHAVIFAAQSSDGGHSHIHDDPLTDDRNSANWHGQHTADHSHDKPNLQRSHVHVVVKVPRMWTSVQRCSDYPEPCFSFERPPKHLLPV
jgi:hypothetical protein